MMANRQEVDPRWEEAKRRLAADPKLSEALRGIEAAIDAADDGGRPRLKVPYASATSIDNDSVWK